MSHKLFELKAGAIIIADAHYSTKRPKLLSFLKSILSGKTEATQLILMGDIFDILFGVISLTYRRNIEPIEIINKISKKIQVVYLEGNHDFAIKRFFPDIQVIPLEIQPLHVRYKNQDVLLAHGDFDSDIKYKIYTKIIRSRLTLSILGLIDILTSHGIIHWLDNYLSKKDDCREIENFESIVKSKIKKNSLLKYDVLIEGHYHQNKIYEYKNFKYINLAAFACNERYFVVKSKQELLQLQELQFR
jgi:UDP-2,3-diacylglucosamine hydrolase